MRELRKSRLEMVSQSYDYHAPNADYIIIVRCNRKGYVSRLQFAFIKETLEYVGVATQLGHKGIVSYPCIFFVGMPSECCMISPCL